MLRSGTWVPAERDHGQERYRRQDGEKQRERDREKHRAGETAGDAKHGVRPHSSEKNNPAKHTC